jgi:hypothetical protein
VASGIPFDYTSMAFDGNSLPAISFIQGYTDTEFLGFARYDGAEWVIETVDEMGYNDSSLAFAPDSQPAITYGAAPPYEFRYAKYSGADWNIDTIATDDSGVWSDLEFGPDNQPAVGYIGPDWTVRFVYYDGDSWESEEIDSYGEYPSLAFGPDGNPAITYRGTGGGLKFARFNGDIWEIVVVDSDGPNVGQYTSLQYGPDGHPAVSYYADDWPVIRYAHFDGVGWQTESVHFMFGFMGSSLAFGPDGQPAVATSVTPSDLAFFYFDGTEWIRQQIDSEGGDYASLAYAPNGRAGTGYVRPGGVELMFAWLY